MKWLTSIVVGIVSSALAFLTLFLVVALFTACTSQPAYADHKSDLAASGNLCNYAHRMMMAGAYFRENDVSFNNIQIKWHGDESPDDVAMVMTYLRRGYYSIDDSGKPMTPLAYEALRLQTCRGEQRSQLP